MTEQAQLVRTERRGSAAWLIIDSPANRNALGGPLLAELASHVKSALAAPDVRVLVVTGTDNVFSAGADLRDTSDASYIEQVYRDLFGCLLNADKPVLARINGHCFGIALGLAAACDLSITVDNALFGFPEVRLGLTATLATVLALPRLRQCDAAELLLRGNRFDGSRAAELGLVNKAVPEDQLDADVDEVVSDLLAAGPRALANTKLLLRQVPRISNDDAWDLAFQITRETSGSPEALEGTTAFKEKRDPVWPPA